MKILAPDSYTSSREEFTACLTSEAELSFRPMGDLLASFSLASKAGGERNFEVFLATEATPGLRSGSGGVCLLLETAS